MASVAIRQFSLVVFVWTDCRCHLQINPLRPDAAVGKGASEVLFSCAHAGLGEGGVLGINVAGRLGRALYQLSYFPAPAPQTA